MFESLKRHKRILLVLILLVGVVLLFTAPTIKQAVKQGSLYQRYSKWRYKWRSPSDVGSGKNAMQVIIEGPMGIGEDAQGNIFVSDREGKLVWELDKSGRAIVIAGTGRVTSPSGLPPGSSPAQNLDLAMPEGLVVDQNNDILLADSYNHVILKIDRSGNATRFAGTGERGRGAEGVKATDSALSFPVDVRLDSKGNIFIADLRNNRIRKITRDGLITTVAGTGVAGYSGDGGPAINAQLDTPYGIFLDKNDDLLIADSNNNRIRKVTSDGIIQTVAGTGKEGFDGDGGPARAATLNSPQSLGGDPQGRIYIGDEHNNAIRILEPDGTMRTLVGSKGPGFSGDGGPASQAQIADPENIWVRRDGSILITVRDNARLRIISPDGIINTFAGKGPTKVHDYFAPIRLPPVDP